MEKLANESEDFHIVAADPKEHSKAIVNLIKFQELAEFEGLAEQFRPVPLQNDLEKGYCRSFVALSGGQVVAYAIFYYAYSTWESRFIFLEDLYVTPAFRCKGIGTALWKRVAQVCVEENVTRLQWNVLNWNTNAIEFYKKQGAIDISESEGWRMYRLQKADIEKMAKE